MFLKIKAFFSFYLRMLGFSLLAWILADALSVPWRPFLDAERAEKRVLASGPYNVFIIVMTCLCFWFIMFIWTRRLWHWRSPQLKLEFSQRTSVVRDNGISFHWKTYYKESIYEIMQNEVWKYCVWCLYPTIICAYTFGMGYDPHTYYNLALPNQALVSYGISLFKIQYIFFEMFYPLGMLSVPLGLIIGVVFFVLVYALIVTLIKEEVYYRLQGNVQNLKLLIVRFLAKLILVAAVICIVLIIMGVWR